jgi:hypothetical protein
MRRGEPLENDEKWGGRSEPGTGIEADQISPVFGREWDDPGKDLPRDSVAGTVIAVPLNDPGKNLSFREFPKTHENC